VDVGENGEPTCCATSIVGTIAVEFFERDLQLTEVVATPEPRRPWWSMIAVLAAWLAGRRLTARRSKTAQDS
jgi:hypothetical protein